METVNKNSKAALWTGWIITTLVTLFMLFDAIMKIVKEAHSVEGSTQLGWPVEHIQDIGIALLISTILYAIPRTAILGAILLTGYLGGAAAVMVRAMMPGHPFLFPVVVGILAWAGIYFRDAKLRTLVPFRQKD